MCFIVCVVLLRVACVVVWCGGVVVCCDVVVCVAAFVLLYCVWCGVAFRVVVLFAVLCGCVWFALLCC